MDVYRAYDCFRHGDCVEAVPLTEHSPLREKLCPYRSQVAGTDDWLYDYDKILVEREIMATVTPRGTILRLPAVYGPRTASADYSFI